MGKYPYARVKVGDNIIRMTSVELSQADDFINLKEALVCPEEVCEARLIFNQRSGGFFSKHKSSEHSDACSHKENSIKPIRSQEIIGSITESLDDKSIKKRQDYAWLELEKFLNPPVPEERTPSTRRGNNERRVSDSIDNQPVVRVVLNGEGSLQQDDVPSDAIRRGPRFSFRRLDQISEGDNNSNLNVVAQIDSVRVISDFNVEISVSLNNRFGKVLLPEVYFKGNGRHNELQLMDVWKIIRDYLLRDEHEHFYVNFQSFSELIDVNDLKLSASDPDFINFRVNNQKVSIYTLAVLINTNVI